MNWYRTTRPQLVPEQGIEIVNDRTVASSTPAWLRIEPASEFLRHRWVWLRYSASFFDDPVRPLIRFFIKGGDTIIQPMNGPILGSAEWIGRIPDGAVTAAISPVSQAGPFAFRVDCVTPVRAAALAIKGLHRGPDWLYWAARSHLVNSRREAWQALNFATDGTPLRAYAKWHARLARPIDLADLDQPRSNWSIGPNFRFIVRLRGGEVAALAATIRSLRAQVYPHWSLCAITDATTSTALLAAYRQQAANDPHLTETVLDAKAEPLRRDFAENDFVALIDVGDRLVDHALAVVAETLAQDVTAELLYSDEDCIAADGTLQCPILKPDWSPVLQRQRSFVGRLRFFRSRLITQSRFRRLIVDEDGVTDEVCREIQSAGIRHIRRLLYSRAARTIPTNASTRIAAGTTHLEASQWPAVTVVIPTRDQAKLLTECLAGLRYKTDYPYFETIVVDNGSKAPDAVQLLRTVASASHTRVLHRPGPFNFSALSNDGAGSTKSPILLFLNNDIDMLDRSWLKAMVRWAIKPEIGVVGARLLFANGQIQHAGVVLGFGGIAGHIYRRLPKEHRGYLEQLTVPREVAAVTGACIAVERSKFEAVGGFDTENLPVDLNDIDFCLRIAEHGWTNIWTPEATLIHHQSATRGIDPDPFALYRKERAYFVKRWLHVIRDDPYFHPGLSLYSHGVALA